MNAEKAKQVNLALKRLAKEEIGLSMNELRVVVALGRRFTRDADALAISIPKDSLKSMITQALTRDLDDGFWFGGRPGLRT